MTVRRLILPLLTLSLILPAGCGPKVKTGRDYVSHCASVIVDNASRSRTFEGAKPALVEPKIVSEGPPAVVRCGVTLKSGQIVVIEIEALCDAGLEPHCSRVRPQ